MISTQQLICIFGLLTASAAAEVTVTTQWSHVTAQSNSQLFGVNVWDGLDPAVAADSTYLQAMQDIDSKLLRYHAADQINESGSRQSWLDVNNRTWDEGRVIAALEASVASPARVLINISGWPSWMSDPSGSGRLDPEKIEDYAEFCADLVRITNVSHDLDIQLWEPINEKDNYYTGEEHLLADILNACYLAMKQVDPTIQVGGVAWQVPYDYEGMERFLDRVEETGKKLDFYTYHHYATGNGEINPNEVFQSVTGIVWFSEWVRTALDKRGMENLEIWLDEYNVFSAWQQDQSRRLMASRVGMIFHALTFKEMATLSDVSAMASWNESDGIYGLLASNAFGSNFEKRPSALLFQLANQYLHGDVSLSLSSAPSEVSSFAVFDQSKFSLLLINKSNQEQSVDARFPNWQPTNNNYAVFEISGSDLEESSGTYNSSGLSAITMGPYSVKLLVFEDASGAVSGGQQPYGGTALLLPGILEVENYDHGGQGVAYREKSFENKGDSNHRNDRIDLYTTGDSLPPSTIGSVKVGEFESGEWLEFTVTIEPGIYDIGIRFASQWGGSGIQLFADEMLVLDQGLTQTWGDENFQTASVQDVIIPANTRTLKLVSKAGGYFLNYIQFEKIAELPTTGYAGWQAGVNWRSSRLSDRGPSADPDRDGSENFLEFAMGTDPAQANPSMFKVEPTTNGMVLQFPVKQTTLTYKVIESSDLLNWSTLQSIGPGVITDSYQMSIDISGIDANKTFFRLDVTE